VKSLVRRTLQLFALILCAHWTPGVRADVFQHPLGTGDHAAAFAALAAAVQGQELVTGAFTQTKHLRMLDRPLITRGTFSLSRDAFEWRIESPFALQYRFTGQQLTRTADGVKQLIPPSSEPALYSFFSFFTSLFNLSQDSLEKLFKVFFLPADATWELGLVPVQPQIAKAIQQLHITGSGNRIQLVKLSELNGDITEVSFSYPEQASPAP
jgi:hypothetical protein